MLLPDDRNFGESDSSFFLPALIEVHQTLYGGVGDDSHLTGVPSEGAIRSVVERCYEIDAVYENPVLSFASRPAITDAFLLSRSVSSLCVPGLSLSALCSPTRWLRGAAHLVRASLGWSSSTASSATGSADGVSPTDGRWKVANVWSEYGDIAESQSFDHFCVAFLDHTLHIQLVPSLAFIHGRQPPTPPTVPSTPFLCGFSTHSARPTTAPPSSLFHIQLRMLSVFQFNEAGRIVFQRDHWDLRDLIESVVPGSAVVGAVGRWAGGLALRLVGRATGGCGRPTNDGRQRLWEERQHVDLAEAAAAGAFSDPKGAYVPAAVSDNQAEQEALAGLDPNGSSNDWTSGGGGPFGTGSAPMTTFASTGGTTSPLSPTLQLRPFASAAANGLDGLASPTLTASLLLASQQQSPPQSVARTRPRRGTSSRSWGSRVGGAAFPSAVGAGPSDGLSKALPSAEDLRGMLGLHLDGSLGGTVTGHMSDYARPDDDTDAGRALDHAP